MNKREFVRRRTPAWERFEKLVNRLDTSSQKRLKSKEVTEVSKLFRELSNDLAAGYPRACKARNSPSTRTVRSASTPTR